MNSMSVDCHVDQTCGTRNHKLWIALSAEFHVDQTGRTRASHDYHDYWIWRKRQIMNTMTTGFDVRKKLLLHGHWISRRPAERQHKKQVMTTMTTEFHADRRGSTGRKDWRLLMLSRQRWFTALLAPAHAAIEILLPYIVGMALLTNALTRIELKVFRLQPLTAEFSFLTVNRRPGLGSVCGVGLLISPRLLPG